MRIKPGASIYNRDPIMRFADAAVAEACAVYGVEPVITSGTDGVHGIRSFHYSGFATDYRSKTIIREALDSWVDMISASLGVRFTVILEDRDGPNEHLHVERDDPGTRPLSAAGRVHYLPPLET